MFQVTFSLVNKGKKKKEKEKLLLKLQTTKKYS